MEDIDYNVSQGKSSDNGSRWHKIGQARKHDKGFWLRMDVMPIPNEKGEIWLNLFERMEEDGVQKTDEKKEQPEAVYKNRPARSA